VIDFRKVIRVWQPSKCYQTVNEHDLLARGASTRASWEMNGESAVPFFGRLEDALLRDEADASVSAGFVEVLPAGNGLP